MVEGPVLEPKVILIILQAGRAVVPREARIIKLVELAAAPQTTPMVLAMLPEAVAHQQVLMVLEVRGEQRPLRVLLAIARQEEVAPCMDIQELLQALPVQGQWLVAVRDRAVLELIFLRSVSICWDSTMEKVLMA
jgi:hypothetical protein